MFCPNCGKSDQAPDSYCRSCGEFLADFSAKSYLINKLLGGSSPRTQIKVNLIINVVTVFVSALLLGFLNGYYDSLRERTGEAAPRIIYLVYIFLGLVTAWQLLGFLINLRLKRKLDGMRKGKTGAEPSVDENGLPSPPTQRSLTRGDFDNVGPASVTQHTTKILDKTPRR
jgi:hypothetical protein